MSWATVFLIAAVLAAAVTVGHTTRTRAEKLQDRIEDARRDAPQVIGDSAVEVKAR